MVRPSAKWDPVGTKAASNPVRPPLPAWVLPMVLAVFTMAVFWPVTRNGFLDFDDPAYVTANRHVQAELNWDSVQWAAANPVCGNWHPVTMLSHMLACQAFGLNAWGHHLFSVSLHALNAVLVFLLLQQLTGSTWRSLSVAT